jgi:hypothetical protein
LIRRYGGGDLDRIIEILGSTGFNVWVLNLFEMIWIFLLIWFKGAGRGFITRKL